MRLLALGTLARQAMGATLRQCGAVLALRAAAGACGLGILIVALISLHRLLGERYGPYWADGGIALIFLVVALALLIAASAMERRARRREQFRKAMLAATKIAADALPDKQSALQAALIAAIAGGLWFGRKK